MKPVLCEDCGALLGSAPGTEGASDAEVKEIKETLRRLFTAHYCVRVDIQN